MIRRNRRNVKEPGQKRPVNNISDAVDTAWRKNSEALGSYAGNVLEEYEKIEKNIDVSYGDKDDKPDDDLYANQTKYEESEVLDELIKYLESIAGIGLDTKNLIKILTDRLRYSLDYSIEEAMSNIDSGEIIYSNNLASVVDRVKKGEPIEEVIDSLKKRNQRKKK